MRIENKKTWFGAIFLIALEQFIKIIINAYYLHERFAILPPFIYFEPMFNRRYSWFNSMLELGDGRWLHIITVSVLTLFICLFYQYVNKNLGSSRIINYMFVFIFSGAVCSLIDKLFWDGSLDYILINGLFTFDLKDVYINIFNGLLIIGLIFNNKAIKQISDEFKFNDFIKYVLKRS
ncbi:MAG: signal peptidase II [Bacillota bacterium]|nr:signal peptidase II [Bacillota bacterium]